MPPKDLIPKLLKPNQKSKKLQSFLAYIAVSEVHASSETYSTEGKHQAAFDKFKLIVLQFFKADTFPFNDEHFNTVFDVKEFSTEQLMLSTSKNPLTPTGLWEKGMDQRKFETKYVAEHSSLLKSVFMLRTAPSASAASKDDEDTASLDDDVSSLTPNDVVVELPSGTTLDDLLVTLQLRIYQYEYSESQKAGGGLAGAVVDLVPDKENAGEAAITEANGKEEISIPSELPNGHVDVNWLIICVLFFKADKWQKPKCQFLLTILSYVVPGGGGQQGPGSASVPKVSRTEQARLKRAAEGIARQTSQSEAREAQKQAQKSILNRAISFEEETKLLGFEMEAYKIEKEFMDEPERRAAVEKIRVKRARLNKIKEENDRLTQIDNEKVAEIQSKAAGIKKEDGSDSAKKRARKVPTPVNASVFTNTPLGKSYIFNH